MVTGVAESWYHEKQSAWLYRRMLLSGGGAGIAAWAVGKLHGASIVG